MSSEGAVQRMIWLATSAVSRLFRVNTGRGWVSGIGKVERRSDGSVIVYAARPVSLGFGMVNGKPLNGMTDLCGWTTVEITPEMVGRSVAVFTAIEAKKTKGGRTSADQANVIGQVQAAGGIAGVANSPEAALHIIDQWRSHLL